MQSRSQREKNRSGRGATHLDTKGSGLSWKYWQEMADVIPDAKLRLWDALYEALKKYYANLQQRAKVLTLLCLSSKFQLITGNDDLRKQNEELRILLHTYMTSDVNKQLEIPPSKVLNIDS